MEQGQLDTGFLAGFDQCVLRLILRPGCRHYARIFCGVGIADHHHLFALNKAAIPVDVQQLAHHVVGVVQVVEGLKQRGDRQGVVDSRFFQQEVNAQHVGWGFRHGDHIGGDRSFRCVHDRFTGVEHFAGIVAWLPVARQQRALGVQLADQERLFVGFGPAFIVADAEVAGQLAQRFGMTGTFLTNVDTYQRHAETLHATQGVEQFAVGNDAHPAGLQRFITGVQRLPKLFILAEQAFWFWQTLAFQARFQPGLSGHQLTTQFFHQETVRLAGAFFTGQRA